MGPIRRIKALAKPYARPSEQKKTEKTGLWSGIKAFFGFKQEGVAKSEEDDGVVPSLIAQNTLTAADPTFMEENSNEIVNVNGVETKKQESSDYRTPIKSTLPVPLVSNANTSDITNTIVSQTHTSEQEKTPNKILEQFFRMKGSEPLSAVEMAGCVRLLEQATDTPIAATPYLNKMKETPLLKNTIASPVQVWEASVRKMKTPTLNTPFSTKYPQNLVSSSFFIF